VAAGSAGYEDAVSPDDRAGMREPGNRSVPQNILTTLAVPSIGNVLLLGYPRSLRSAEGGPNPDRGFRISTGRRPRAGCPHDLPRQNGPGLIRGNPGTAV